MSQGKFNVVMAALKLAFLPLKKYTFNEKCSVFSSEKRKSNGNQEKWEKKKKTEKENLHSNQVGDYLFIYLI